MSELIEIKDNAFLLEEAKEHFLRYKNANLFSKGSDFTNPMAKVVSLKSMFLALYQGDHEELGLAEKTLFRTFEIYNAKQMQIGVLMHWQEPGTFETFLVKEPPAHPRKTQRLTVPAIYLGQWGCFLQAPYRGQGIMKRLVQEKVAPILDEQQLLGKARGAIPCVTASHAMANLISPYLHQGTLLMDRRVDAKRFPAALLDRLYGDAFLNDDLRLLASLPIPATVPGIRPPDVTMGKTTDSWMARVWRWQELQKQAPPSMQISQPSERAKSKPIKMTP